MAECLTTTENIVNANDILILTPIACPDASGDIPDMYVIEGQSDGSLSSTLGTVEDNEKRGNFAQFVETRLNGEVAVNFRVYNDAAAAVQDAFADHHYGKRLIPLVLMLPDKQYICGKGRITSYNLSSTTDEGAAKVTSTVQFTGPYGKSTENLK